MGIINIRQFLRAAGQRLDSAEVLLDHGMNLDAVYLAGYGVECALKAVLLANLPQSIRVETEFKGSAWHDYELLKGRLRKKGVVFPDEVDEALQNVRTWLTDLRYAVGHVPDDEALAFYEAARVILSWAKGRCL